MILTFLRRRMGSPLRTSFGFALLAFTFAAQNAQAQASGADPSQPQRDSDAAERVLRLPGAPDHPIVVDAHEGNHRWIDEGRRRGTLANHGSSRISVLSQFWLTSAFGDRPNGTSPQALRPPGRTYAGGFGDPFRFRRLQIALDGYFNARVDYRIMVDPFRTNNVPGGGLQDLWIGYQIGRNVRIEAGQQKTGLSEEGQRSNGDLLTAERSILNSLPLKAGRVGNVRDIGLSLRYDNPILHPFIGFWKDNGTGQSDFSRLNLKFLTGGFYYSGIRHITFGLWGGTFVGQTSPAEARERGGATLLYQTGPHTFEGEIAYARDYAPGAPAVGRTGSISRLGYLLYAHSLSKQWQLVGRFENSDPAHQGQFTGIATTENGVTIQAGDHKLKEYLFGINYYIPRRNSKIQFNIIREDAEINARPFFGKQRYVLLTNFQARF